MTKILSRSRLDKKLQIVQQYSQPISQLVVRAFRLTSSFTEIRYYYPNIVDLDSYYSFSIRHTEHAQALTHFLFPVKEYDHVMACYNRLARRLWQARQGLTPISNATDQAITLRNTLFYEECLSAEEKERFLLLHNIVEDYFYDLSRPS